MTTQPRGTPRIEPQPIPANGERQEEQTAIFPEIQEEQRESRAKVYKRAERSEEDTRGLNFFFEDALNQLDSFEVKIYRVIDLKKRQRAFLRRVICQKIDDIPSEEEIGEEYGSGHYVLMGIDTENRQMYSKDVIIDRVFDSGREPFGRYNPNTPKPGSEISQLELMKSMVEILKPFIEARVSPQTATAEPSYFPKMMNGVMDTLTEGMKKMSGAMIDSKIESLRPAEPDPGPPPANENAELIQSIVGMVKEWGGTFLKAKGPQEAVIKNVIQEDERFQKITEDQQLFNQLYTELVSDPNVGQAKANAIFQKLGFDTAGGEEEATKASQAADSTKPTPPAPTEPAASAKRGKK